MITEALAYLVEYLDLPTATGDESAEWEDFQLQHLSLGDLLAIERKSRQVGWSWTAAAEATAICAIKPRSTAIFVSINQEEAGEKVRYSKFIIEALDAEARPKLIRDNQLYLEFQNGSRLISHPCRPVRGKAKALVYLDEFAHYPNDREIYESALPVISKGGVMRIGSSPLGARGMFWEIFTQSLKSYPGYARNTIEWWHIRHLCKDVGMARLLAPQMPTEERVATFGTPRLIQIYENMPLDSFQQEYECAWLDESVSWIDWELIKRNQLLAARDELRYLKVKGVDAALEAIKTLREWITRGWVEDVLVGGTDIGRIRDTTEIVLIGKSTTGQLPYRLGITLDRVEFSDQEVVINNLMTNLPVLRLLIDQNGIGMQLAENMAKLHHQRVEGVSFSSATKELWAVETKVRFQNAEVPIPLERDLAYQIHSIRRESTESLTNKYDSGRTEGHHADMFWALALAIYASKSALANKTKRGKNPLRKHRG